MNLVDEKFITAENEPSVFHLEMEPPAPMPNGYHACAYRLSLNDKTIAAAHIYGVRELGAILLTLTHVADLLNYWAIDNQVSFESGPWDDLKKLCTPLEELRTLATR